MTDPNQTADCATAQSSLILRRALSVADRDACMLIRMSVFVDEQQVSPQEEIDGLDDSCLHYVAFADSRAVATARVIPKPPIAKIGRVAVVRELRGKHIGLDLMRFVLRDVAESGFTEAILDSQTYAIAFYARLGFVAEGAEFLDAGIPHYRMRRSIERRDAAI
jgi:ElaA protein